MKPQPRERRSSLAAVQKTLDSILEESEHGSSTKRSNIESSDSCDEDSETVSELTDENEDDFLISIDEIKKEGTLDQSCLDEKEPQVYQSEMNDR